MLNKRFVFAALIVLLLTLAVPVTAQGPVTPQHSDPTWAASYWNNTTLSGTPVLQRSEANIDHNWSTGSPQAGTVNSDRFSARWTRYIDVTPGTYTFTVTSDDGIRVWVDGKQILNEWHVHPPQTFTTEAYLGSGHHEIKVEYFEETGIAVAQVSWALKSQDPTPITNWKGEYFNNMTLGGSPVLTRNDAALNFDWGTGSPAPGTVDADHFSARWTQTVDLSAGMYTFSLTVDDGARMWVNGHLLVDAWYHQAPTTYSDALYLPGGPVTVEVQYYENEGGAVAKLSWTPDGGQPPTPTPSDTVIVDDTDAGFVKGGTAAGWRTASEGYNGRLTWTYNNNTAQYDYNWARWYPELRAGWYRVYVYIPYWYTTTGQARYWISHAGGYTLRVVDQSDYDDEWVYLGRYRFEGNNEDYVSLADATYEPYRTRLIGFDAVKWEAD
jgi:hypothetical protein